MEPQDSLPLLQTGEISLEGQFLWGSNSTLLVHVAQDEQVISAVYKPTEGVRQLWDFDAHTLALREVAAFIVSEALGWDLVPPTVLRSDGPFGMGSLQVFVEHNPDYHYFNFSPEDRQRMRPVAAFDIVINNADRKGGEPIPEDLCRDMTRMLAGLQGQGPVYEQLSGCLSGREMAALVQRLERLLAGGVFPKPPSNTRPYPWPLV
jgi:hypothetical protein